MIEKLRFSLNMGRFGAYGTLGGNCTASVVSLRVEDFRIGFYIAIINPSNVHQFILFTKE